MSIRVWDEAWISVEGAHRVPTMQEGGDVNMRVHELIDFGTGEWDLEKVDATFCEEDKQAIVDIPLSRLWPNDKRYWWPTSDGLYSVRSGYWLARMGHLRTWELFYGVRDDDLWRTVWGLGGTPKLSHFLWRACMGSLATMDVIFLCHIRPTRSCPVCSADRETIVHKLFECTHAVKIWEQCEFGSTVAVAPTTSFADRIIWMKGRVDNKQLLVFASLVWAT